MQLTGNVQGMLDFIGGGVQDVKVDGVSVVDDENVANIILPDAGVQDVEVDGVSVVNEDGIAEITLPDAPVQGVEVDGVSVVNEDGIAEITLPSGGTNYTTSEQDTGLTWIDGKKIYQKTFQETINNSTFRVSLASLNVDRVIDIRAYASNSGNTEGYFLPFFATTNNKCWMMFENNSNGLNVRFDVSSNMTSTYNNLTFTILYTKST